MRWLKNSAIYVAGECISRVSPFVLFLYLSRVLGVEQFGKLSFYLSLIPFIVWLLAWNQTQALARYYHRYGKRSASLLVMTGHGYSLLLMLLLMIVAQLFLPSEHIVIADMLIVCAGLQSWFNTQMTWLQMNERALTYAGMQIVLSIGSVLLTVCLFYVYQPIPEARILAILLSCIVPLISMFVLFIRQGVPLVWSVKHYQKSFVYLLSFGFPLLWVSFSTLIKGQLDKLLVFQYYSLQELGVYAVAYQLSTILSILILGLNTAFVPQLYEKLKKGEWTVSHVLRFAKIAVLCVPVPAALLALLPESVFLWVLGSGYVGMKYFLLCFVLTAMLEVPYLILLNYLVFIKRIQFLGVMSLCSVGLYALLLMLFLPQGMAYIPFAAMLTSLSLVVLTGIFTLKGLKSS